MGYPMDCPPGLAADLREMVFFLRISNNSFPVPGTLAAGRAVRNRNTGIVPRLTV